MARRVGEVLVVLIMLLLLAVPNSKAMGIRHRKRSEDSDSSSSDGDKGGFCLSWRLGVEANNVVAWPTIPPQCSRYVETYMIGGQYDRDLELIVQQILGYLNHTSLLGDAMDAWILDVDDTCISNIYYYKSKKYGYVSVHTHTHIITLFSN